MARRRTRFIRPAPRSNVWIGLNVAPVAIAAASDVTVATFNAAALALRPFTIVRTRAFF